LELAVLVSRRLGRAACPLPVLDGYAATQLLSESASRDIAAGVLRVVVAAGESGQSSVPYVDAGEAATHVLIIPISGGRAELRSVADSQALPGLAIPPWTRVTLGEAVESVDIDSQQADRALTLVRLGAASCALGAAEYTHRLAIEHAKNRTQFGQVISSFGAVAQRTAQCEIEVRSANLLVDDAVTDLKAHTPTAVLSSEIAVAHVAAVAPQVQLGAHHTLAATGYFEEHLAPWLFRRVHADITRLSTNQLARGSIGDVLVETEARLPATDLDEVGKAFRAEYLRLIAEHDARDKGHAQMIEDPAVVAAIADRGWLGFGWPKEAGGRDASLAEQVALIEETAYNRVGATKALASVMLLGESILKHGSEEQKQKFLPIIRSGKMSFCLGYSEPEAGSDLASLRTRAARDGNEWVINGQKLWTTGAHTSDWVWLAARTDPDAEPRHAGITVFLFSLHTPGVTIQQHTALSGEVSCSVFYDNVRVPDSARVGEVNGGWQVIVDALAGERITMGSIAASVHRQLDDLLDVVRSHPNGPDAVVGARGSAKRQLVADLAVQVQATRALVRAAVQACGTEPGAVVDGAMAGVMGGDLSEDFGEAMLKILGPAAALGAKSAHLNDIPGGGTFEYGLRQSIMYVVGGGTNDVQRGLIARAIGLPR
jgi:alkylation response protein AidB-like acyl-CoA dehydrogenase